MFFAYALQVVIVLALAIFAGLWQGSQVVAPALFGGIVALANTGLLVWRWRRSRYDYHCDGERHLRQFHRSSLERFFVVVVLLALGWSGLQLQPLPMLLGFIVGQVVWIITAASLKTD
jgi:ATP synthase protein I